MTIANLPEVTDFIPQPLYDQQTTNITALVLRKDAFRNPLECGLSPSIANLTKAKNAAAGLNDSDINRVLSHVLGTTPETDPNAPGYSGFTEKVKNDLVSGLTSLKNFKKNLNTGLGASKRFLEHTNLLTEHAPALAGMMNNSLSMAKRLTSDIPGLPSSFPFKLPGFSKGPDGLPIPSFNGLSLPTIPSFGISEIDISSLPDITSLPGLGGGGGTGVPDPSKILNAFSGSISLPEFGGVGSSLAGAMGKMSGVAADLAGSVTSSISSMASSLTSSDITGGIFGPTSIPSLTNLSFSPGGVKDIADLGKASDSISKVGGGMHDVVGSEEGAINGASCAMLAPGGACAGASSVQSAVGQAGAIVNMAKTQTAAKLLASVASPSLAKQFPDELSPDAY